MMSNSFAVYPSNCADAESKNAYYLQGQFNNTFWSPADQSAFHNHAYYGNNYSNYSELDDAQMNYAWSQGQQNGWYHDAQQAGEQPTFQCALNLSDFSDWSDSEEEKPSPVASPVAAKQVLPKLMPSDSVRLDDSSTDADSTADASSTINASDSSDNESEVCSSPKAIRHVHTRDALLLIRAAVGICAAPPAQWSTQPRTASSTSTPKSSEGNGTEWRKEAAAKQTSSGNVKLVSSPNSWGAQQIKIARAGPTQSDEEIVRGMKSILNKLTLEKFDALYVKLINCGIHTDAHIKLLVLEIFDKACLQHQFVDMYADLCMRIEKWLDIAQICINCNGFRRILLNQCQQSFEASVAPSVDLTNDLPEEELLEAKMRHKQRVLGNVRLIAALLVRGVLAPRILLSVAQTLLQDTSASDALESLAVFLTSVGPTFDDKEWTHHSLLCSIFDKVKGLANDKTVAPRIRFLLKDVLDLRGTSWADMKKATKKMEGPMKLKDVLAKQRSEESEQLQGQRSQKPNPKSDDHNFKGLRGQKPNQKSDDHNFKGLKAVLTPSKPGSPKTNMGDKKHKSDGEEHKTKQNGKKKGQVAPSSPAMTHQNSTAQPPAQPSRKVAAAEPPKSPSKETQQANAPFDLRIFRRQLNEILKELGATRDTVSAFRRLEGVQVPAKFQAPEFSNLLTRIAEEQCSASRRVMFAFSASLAGKTFNRDMCATGIKSFFDDVYEDLCEEVPRLPEILKNELVPTMRATIDADKLNKILPASLK